MLLLLAPRRVDGAREVARGSARRGGRGRSIVLIAKELSFVSSCSFFFFASTMVIVGVKMGRASKFVLRLSSSILRIVRYFDSLLVFLSFHTRGELLGVERSTAGALCRSFVFPREFTRCYLVVWRKQCSKLVEAFVELLRKLRMRNFAVNG